MVRNSQNFWSLGLLVLSGVLFFIAENDGSLSRNSGRSEQASLAPRVNLDQRLNEHLQETSEAVRLNDELRKVEALRPPTIAESILRPDGFGSVAKPTSRSSTNGLGLTDETLEDDVYHRLHEHDPKSSSALTPGDIVNIEVQQKANEMRAKKQIEQSRREIVRQYIENARRMGYSVTINKDYVVERVERLPNSVHENSSDTRHQDH